MPREGRLDGYILITSSDGQEGTLRTFRLNGELWIVTAWHPVVNPKDGWPARIVRPPPGHIKAVSNGAKHKFILVGIAPTGILLPDCPTGIHHGFTVRTVPKS